MAKIKLRALLAEIHACQVCAAYLPYPPNPILRARADARLLLIGQAPGRRVHETGVPWNDPSGDTLRDWLQLTPEQFYDDRLVAIVPSGFCYPGAGRTGDLPPRPECAPLWHPPLLASLPNIKLTLLIGSYAQACYLKERNKATLTETVANGAEYLPRFLPLPHPSPCRPKGPRPTPCCGSCAPSSPPIPTMSGRTSRKRRGKSISTRRLPAPFMARRALRRHRN